MLRPIIHPISETRGSSRAGRIGALAAAGVIEVALVGALISGLAGQLVKQLPHELSMVDLITPTPTPPVETAPVPKPDMVKPEVPTVPVPVIRIQQPTPAPTITVVATPVPVVSTTPTPVTSEPAPVVGPPSTPAQTVAGTHTTPPYPELSRRFGEFGQVQVHIAIAASGQVTDVQVTKSSGSERLDTAAREWVLANWRYRAALLNGTPVASETDALVVFDLKNAR